ncbi:ERCC4 domain-containing protein [Spironucleus salmonicida]|uniref:DNA repair protein (Rad1) domain-containing protein n=1 Tax=Spironucleus salmonicida TaxID=348837 RepID=V6LBQ2_9EUKA|nr:ERCC4 domain-containing protein [Spironucleus salmonicida]|eukprot:EST41862.1 DNA repair protein (rad1) domain-containing protein [Spironucleus salmonicida]
MLSLQLDPRGEQFYILLFPKDLLSIISIKTLHFGDFAVLKNDKIVATVERKTGSDLASSIQSGRLLHQLKQIKNVHYSYLLIEGKFEKADFHNAFQVCYSLNIKLVLTKNEQETVKFYIKLYNFCGESSNLRGVQNEGKFLTFYQKMIQNLYGSASQEILKHFNDFPKISKEDIYYILKFKSKLTESIIKSYIQFVFG